MPDENEQPEKFMSVNDDFNLEDLTARRPQSNYDEKEEAAKQRIQKLEADLNQPKETMSLHELRIGSIIVSAKRAGAITFGIVTALDTKGVQACDYYEAPFSPNMLPGAHGYFPTEVNAYWLQRFGFVKQEDEHFAKQLTPEVTLMIKPYMWNFYVRHADSSEFFANTNNRVKYIHQLQNLALALSGQELQWKEESI
jgi:hypothetical protein